MLVLQPSRPEGHALQVGEFLPLPTIFALEGSRRANLTCQSEREADGHGARSGDLELCKIPTSTSEVQKLDRHHNRELTATPFKCRGT